MMRSPLKIALLGDAAHVNVQRWCEGLSRAGAEVHVLAFAGHVPHAAATHRLPAWPRLSKLRYFTTIPYVRRLIRTIRPDVMIGYYVTGYGALAAWSGFHPLVQATSGSDVLIAPQHALMRQIVRFSLSHAQLVTAWAPHMAEAARQLGVPEGKLFTLPRGIPSDEFVARHCVAPAQDLPVRLICTRSLKASYQIDILIRAMACLQLQGFACELTLAGDGPQRGALEQLARELRVEQDVRFAGFVSNDCLPTELAQQHMYLSLSPSDGVSASLLEAMAVGLLPIVPDNAANRHWITPGDNGLLLNDLTVDTVVATIQAGAEDLELRQRAGQINPTTVVERADLYRNAEQYVARFCQIAGRPASSECMRLRQSG